MRTVLAGVRVHNIQQHFDAEAVSVVNQLLELLGGA